MKKLRLPLLIVSFIGYTSFLPGQVSVPAETDSPDLVKVYVKQDPTTYQKTSTQTEPIDFAVQVAASSRPIDQSSAGKEWKELGNVYVHQENGLYKLRIGPFDTQQEAKEILLQAKSKGKKDAFIVVLQGTNNDKPLYQSGMENKTAKTTKDEKEPTVVKTEKMEKQEPEVQQAHASEYKVRVASYLKPGSFNPNEIDKLGELESYRKGELTIMMIGGFKNLADAQKAQKIVVSKGFPDAVIVVDNNGILEEVQ